MKFLLPFAVLSTSIFVVGCNSLDNPVGGLLDTGRDARVYNAQTGQFEWPKESEKRHGHRAGAARPSGTPVAERRGDGRYFDLQKNQWVEAPEERSSAPRPKAKPATTAPVLMTTPVPVGTPPPVRPARASGIYNPSTGQIEWRDFDPAPATAPAPEKKKSWYWPF